MKPLILTGWLIREFAEPEFAEDEKTHQLIGTFEYTCVYPLVR